MFAQDSSGASPQPRLPEGSRERAKSSLPLSAPMAASSRRSGKRSATAAACVVEVGHLIRKPGGS
jgi:hypothetical protein